MDQLISNFLFDQFLPSNFKISKKRCLRAFHLNVLLKAFWSRKVGLNKNGCNELCDAEYSFLGSI